MLPQSNKWTGKELMAMNRIDFIDELVERKFAKIAQLQEEIRKLTAERSELVKTLNQ